MKVTIKADISIEDLVYEWNADPRPLKSAERFLYKYMIDYIYNMGFGEVPKRSYKKIRKKFLKAIKDFEKIP